MRRVIEKIPLIGQIYRYLSATKYKQKFANDCYGCCWGVFDTFEEAIRAAPATKSIGYDCAELAQEYQKMLDRGDWESSKSMVRSFDYPVLYWIGKITQNTTLVGVGDPVLRNAARWQSLSYGETENGVNFFDFGGNLGIHFLNYSNYLDFPDSLRWIVCDLPEIVKVGNASNTDPRLTFTTDFGLANGTDILLASGSVQYDEDLAAKLDSLERRPKHILINRVGLSEGKRIVTLQNGGQVFYPQYIFNRSEFINLFTSIGYELIDIWEDNIDSCCIPFHPEVNVPCYHGLYFKLNNGTV
jgi:putative methyltransferase (TIGR04325 family)